MKFTTKLIAVAILITQAGWSQGFLRPNEWKKYRWEIYGTVGSSFFIGDLGGRNVAGTLLGPADLDILMTRSTESIGGRMKLARTVNVAVKMAHLCLRGDDAETKEPVRNNRNLNFKSNLFEFTGRLEAGIASRKRGANKYGIKKNYGKYRRVTNELYGFIGIGAFYFRTQGRTPENNWIQLYRLHTEGQGLPGGPKQYSRISWCIPVGGFYRLVYNKIWTFGAEFNYRKIFTDYIDDVSGRYYDPKALDAAYGPLSSFMADPNKGLIPGATKPAADATPAQRGNSRVDSYFTIEFTVGYVFKQKRKSARLRSKF